jgi:hypothetical protein
VLLRLLKVALKETLITTSIELTFIKVERFKGASILTVISRLRGFSSSTITSFSLYNIIVGRALITTLRLKGKSPIFS